MLLEVVNSRSLLRLEPALAHLRDFKHRGDGVLNRESLIHRVSVVLQLEFLSLFYATTPRDEITRSLVLLNMVQPERRRRVILLRLALLTVSDILSLFTDFLAGRCRSDRPLERASRPLERFEYTEGSR